MEARGSFCQKCGVEVAEGQRFCSQCGSALNNEAALLMPTTNAPVSARLQEFSSRLSELEARLPNTNLLSRKFWSRAFAVLGHNFSAVIAIYAAIAVVAIVFLIIGIIGAVSR
jgi:uncharacterized membrane protein YvbJ